MHLGTCAADSEQHHLSKRHALPNSIPCLAAMHMDTGLIIVVVGCEKLLTIVLIIRRLGQKRCAKNTNLGLYSRKYTCMLDCF